MIFSTEEVLLNRVTLRGSAEAIDAARAPIKTALEQTDWPTTAPGELLFLRRISANGNPREIAARAADQARRLADAAVDGWSPAAANALAVRFRSQPSLLACLIRDLLQGTAQQRWYWRRWQSVLQRPMDEAIVTLLQEEPLHLPAVVAQLRNTPVWQPFWQQLGSSGGTQLLGVVAQATGWSAAVQMACTYVAPTATIPEQTASISATPQFNLTFLATTSHDPRPLLAALLTLWRQAPTLLNQPTGAEQLQRLARVIAGEPLPTQQPGSPDGVKRNPGATLPDSTVFHPGYSADSSADQIPPSPPFSKGGIIGATINSEDNHHPQAEPRISPPLKKGAQRTGIKGQGGFKEASPSTKANQAAYSQHSNTTLPDESDTSDNRIDHEEPLTNGFITRQGGLFYLLNFLDLPMVRTQLPADQPGAGWRWLHDLAASLGCPPEGELLEFLASECGVELAKQPLAPMEQLLRLGASRYGDEVWQADIWRIPARLIASASHIDLHFRLNDARLPVRRVGLDLNPGWLPWLGRVVTFHYGSGLEPER
jgi:hypothetical protein